VVALLTATVLIGGSPLLMRRGVSFDALGHWITLHTFLIVNAVAVLGFGSEPLWWQAIVVMIAVLLCGIRAGLVWTLVSALGLAGYFRAVEAGIIAESPFSGDTAIYWAYSVMVGLYIVVGLLTAAFESLKSWALDSIRSRGAHTRAILGAVPDGIVTLRRDGRIDHMNRAAEEIFGLDAREHDDEGTIVEYVPSLAGPPERRAAPRSATGEERDASSRERASGEATSGETLERWTGHRYDTQGVRANGTSFPVEVFVQSIEDDDHRVMVVRDITEQHEVQHRLEEAYDEAVRANEAKSLFLANMSHELRTPLNAVIGYSGLVREDLEDMGHEEVLPDLEKVDFAAEHLLSLINDILDISKIEAGHMEVEAQEIDLHALLEDVIGEVEPMMREHGNHFEVDIDEAPDTLEADRAKVRGILLNLLSNAAKFTRDARVELGVWSEERSRRSWCVIEVADEGIGIEEEKLEILFDVFTQADQSSTREFEGTGLGLAITRRYVEMMGGSIGVESTPGEGSTFRVELPARVPPSGAPEEGARATD
jgi:PAS domain S-box-containing protein